MILDENCWNFVFFVFPGGDGVEVKVSLLGASYGLPSNPGNPLVKATFFVFQSKPFSWKRSGRGEVELGNKSFLVGFFGLRFWKVEPSKQRHHRVRAPLRRESVYLMV